MDNQQALKEEFLAGKTLLIDKPYKWTSFDVVNKLKSLLRYILKVKKIKIGHAGTLDPLATGLLIVCTGKATKDIERFQHLDKTYTGTFIVGQTTPSFDLETQPGEVISGDHISGELIKKTAKAFIGEQQQVPPLYSAKKIEGERAYTHARKGETRELKAVTISIRSFDIIRIELPEVDFRVTCSKGTYIRALARDFGESLSSGAYLQSLKRTHIGVHSLDDAISIMQLEKSIRQSE